MWKFRNLVNLMETLVFINLLYVNILPPRIKVKSNRSTNEAII